MLEHLPERERPTVKRRLREAWAANANPSQVLITQTVKDLTAGSGLTLADAGEHELKGVPDRWRLYRVIE